MLRVLSWALYILIVAILTVLTQVGGGILLFSTLIVWSIFPIGRLGRIKAFATHLLAFAVLYTAICALLIPPVAQINGRVALQCFASERYAYAALSRLTCLLNRHYAVPAVEAALKRMSRDINEAQPGTVVAYLDVGFPFFNGFPVLPHLSHRDGRDIDLAYFYLGPAGRYLPGEARSPIGYFAFEQPAADTKLPCAEQRGGVTLRWDLNWLQPYFPAYMLEHVRTAEMLTWLVTKGPAHGVSGLIIEPHMSERLGVDSKLIRFQGCRAARHDDHVHVDFE